MTRKQSRYHFNNGGATSPKGGNNQTAWRDPDEAPELTDEWFAAAHQYHGETLVKRGRGRPKR
jgi:hypothetical protein